MLSSSFKLITFLVSTTSISRYACFTEESRASCISKYEKIKESLRAAVNALFKTDEVSDIGENSELLCQISGGLEILIDIADKLSVGKSLDCNRHYRLGIHWFGFYHGMFWWSAEARLVLRIYLWVVDSCFNVSQNGQIIIIYLNTRFCRSERERNHAIPALLSLAILSTPGFWITKGECLFCWNNAHFL